MSLLNIELDGLPPSVNKLYRKSMNGHIYVPKQVKEYKERVKKEISKHDVKVSDKKIRLVMIFELKGKRDRDIDNMLKILLDGMNKLIYEDDKQVTEIHCKKVHGKVNKTSIRVDEIDENDNTDCDENDMIIRF